MADTSEPNNKDDDKPEKNDKSIAKTAAKAETPAAKKAAKASAASKAADKSTDKKPADKTADSAKMNEKPATDGGKPVKSSSVPPSGGGSAPSPAEEKSGSGGRVLVVLLILVLAVVGGGYVTRDVWSPMITPYLKKFSPGQSVAKPAEEEKMTVEERLSALEAKVEDGDGPAMQSLQAEADRARMELSKALQRIDDLEGRLSELREVASALTNSSVGSGADLSAVMSRIDGLEESRREDAAEIATLSDRLDAAAERRGDSAGQGAVLALAQLRDAALSGRPYAAQLAAFRQVAGENPDVAAATARLQEGAETGLPTAAALEARFDDIADEVLIASRAASEDWLDQTAAKLSTLISLRRTDGLSGNPVEDAVASLEKQLADRDLTAAVETASTLADVLPENARDIFEPWLLDLKARVAAIRALDAMQASALAALEK